LKINDMFWTFQGEGFNSGTRALFIRMPFCNLKCSWCDTEFDTYLDISEKELIGFANQEISRFAVITGGEPMMNKETQRVAEILKDQGFYIACESNGMFPIYSEIDFVTISPKRDSKYEIHPQALSRADEIKYVVDNGFDFSILDRHDKYSSVNLTLSPEYGNFKPSLEMIFDYIKEHPNWQISLQTHKWMGIA